MGPASRVPDPPSGGRRQSHQRSHRRVYCNGQILRASYDGNVQRRAVLFLAILVLLVVPGPASRTVAAGPTIVSGPLTDNTTWDLAGSPYIVSPDGKYLGNLNNNPYDPNSVANPYGRYGNPYSPDSINNPYGRYGNPYSPDSVTNPYAVPNLPRLRQLGE